MHNNRTSALRVEQIEADLQKKAAEYSERSQRMAAACLDIDQQHKSLQSKKEELQAQVCAW